MKIANFVLIEKVEIPIIQMKTRCFLFLAITIFLTQNIFSEKKHNLHFNQISTKNGLSQNTVRSILEDKKGFIWAGTLDGLNRYDGYNIIAYKPEIGNPNSLVDHRVKDVFQDRNGHLWIKTYNSEFCCYDPVFDSFVNYRSTKSSTKNEYFANYYEARNGDIWLWGNTNGCLRIRKEENEFQSQPFLAVQQIPNKRNCKFLFEDSKSTIWIGGESGLFKVKENSLENFFTKKYSFTTAVELNNKVYFGTENSTLVEYDLKRKTFVEIKNSSTNEVFVSAAKLTNNRLLLTTRTSGLISYNVNTHSFEKLEWMRDPLLKGNIEFIVDKNQGVWLYNHTGIVWYYNQANQQVKKLQLIPPDIARIIDFERFNVFIDSKKLIWITTYGNGLFCYNPENELLENYKYDPNQNSPASDYLLSITEDRYGNIWIGSEYAGIIQVVKSNYDIKVIRPETGTSIGKNNNVRTIYEDVYNKIWVGTKNRSLYVYNSDFSASKCIFQDINPYTLEEDANQQMWVGTKGNGLYVIDVKTLKEKGHFVSQENNPSSLSYNTIFSLLKDSKNRMWVGTFGGGLNLAKLTPKGVEFRRFFVDEGNRSYIRCIYQDSKGQMWVGSSDGVIRFNPDDLIKNPKHYSLFRMDLTNKNSINCNDIKTIFEDSDGDVWIGTAGGGLNKYIPETPAEAAHFVAYTTANGLSGDFVSSIIEDKEHYLWISSESGITKFNKSTNSFIIYQFSEKTYGNHFNENANVFSQNGNILLGCLDGLIIFNPKSFVPSQTTPPVTFTHFLLYDQEVKVGEPESPLKMSISYSDRISLNYKQNTFTIGFATLTLKDPSKNKYQYKLENYDKQWSSISHFNTATYKNLSPGRYLFKVKGTNSDGIWNDQITEIEIHISPPFWKSWYAYIFYTLLLFLTLYFVFRLVYKFNLLNNKIKVEKELTNYKLRFFTNISHEFRTPLTLIRGTVENLNEQADVSAPIKRQLDILSRNSVILTKLIDQLLEFRKLQNNVLALDLEHTDIVEFSKEIFSSFNEIARQKSIDFQYLSEVDSFMFYLDRRKVDKILYNLLSNAFKFTPKGGAISLIVNVNDQNKTCHISVHDNGIGVGKEKQHLLFSRFMQINFSSAGTGIGLSLVKEFVEVHKGKIWYENNTPQGSIFNVELPTDPDGYEGANFITSTFPDVIKPDGTNKVLYPSDNVENIQLPDIDDSTLANYKMLIIDDNDDIRNFLIEEFSRYFMVDTAENGKVGLQKALDSNPDLIICDVMMPEMDGFEVTRQLKEDFNTCHIPIILLTAHSSQEHQLEGIQSGADAYIMKPFSLKFLIARVFKLIEQREQLKKRFSSEYVLDGALITSTDKDKEFFNLIDKILDEHMDDAQFSVDKFAELAKQRRTIFYKKVKGITGLSPNELIKVKRLKRAAELLLKGELTVAEISYKVGFDDPFYFSKCFKIQYNCSPSKYGQVKD